MTFLHYFLHLGLPLLIAWVFFRKNWKQAYLILLATMLVDLDHLLAEPIFQVDRCSIGFHPLHSPYLFPVYLLLWALPYPTLRLIGLGLTLHMLTDFIDCLGMYVRCAECQHSSPIYPALQYIGAIPSALSSEK